MILLLLLACAGSGDKTPRDTSADTGDSADTPESESAEDSVDTGDSLDTGDTGETGDTAPYTEWNPGDDVPGWEDADCTEPHPGRSYTMTFDDVFLAEGRFLPKMPGAGPHLIHLQARDCINFACEETTFDGDNPSFDIDLDATAGDEGIARGVGEWGPDSATNRQVSALGRSMLIDWGNRRLGRTLAEVTVCFERVRPDEVRGTVRAEVFNYPYEIVNYYPSLVYRFPFDIDYPDHSGFDATLPDEPADQPDGYTTAHFIYDQPYDDAWPWDDITDPSIREELYDRYAPYNTP